MVRLKVKRLQEALERSNHSQVQFAERLKISPITLRAYLAGRTPRPAARRKMLIALSLQFDDLFEIVNNKQRGAHR